MTADTPYQWLSRVARDDPGRVCLVDDTHTMSYGDVLRSVDARAHEMRSLLSAWEIVPFEASLDIESVIEMVAIGHAGGVPLPFTGTLQDLPIPTAPDIAVCIATSGSSGPSKVVPLSFMNIAASVAASRARLGNGRDDRWLACLPLDHVGGASIIWRSLEAGGSVVIATFAASGSAIERHRPTIASMVPTMVHRLIESNPAALASIRLVLVGGASISAGLWQRCVDADVRFVSTYGLTEAGSQVATAIPTDAPERCGVPLDGMDVDIVGRDGEPVVDGDTGVISIDGPAVFDGYLGDKSREGPFLTSDLGRFDVEGRLHVEGRVDDVIISGGENVSLGRLAAAIMTVGGVRDVCVVGRPDAEWGAIACAMVASEVGLDVVRARVRRELKPHELPKKWLQRVAIPELPNGKYDLSSVRAAFDEER